MAGEEVDMREARIGVRKNSAGYKLARAEALRELDLEQPTDTVSAHQIRKPGRPPKHSLHHQRLIAANYARERVRCAELIVREEIANADNEFGPIRSELDCDRISDLIDEAVARNRGISVERIDGSSLAIEGYLSTRQAREIDEKKAEVRQRKLSLLREADELRAIEKEYNPGNLPRLCRGLRFRLSPRRLKDIPIEVQTDGQSIRERTAARWNRYAEAFGLAPVKPNAVKIYCRRHRDVCEAVYRDAEGGYNAQGDLP